MENFEKLLLSCINARWQYNDPGIPSCFERTNCLSPQSLLERSIYYTECYKFITHTLNLQLLKERCKLSVTVNQQDSNIPHKVKSCSQSPEEPVEEHSRKPLRSRSEVYNKNACIICQQGESRKLRSIEFLETDPRMINIVELLPDMSFFIRMNTIPNSREAAANDVKYHLKYWVNMQRKTLKTISEKQEIQETGDVNGVIADLEIVKIVTQNVSGDCILVMNNLNKTYKTFLKNDYEIN